MPEERHLLLQRTGRVGHPLEPPPLELVEALLQVQLLRREPLLEHAVVDSLEVDQVVDRGLQTHLAEARQLAGRRAEPGAPEQMTDARRLVERSVCFRKEAGQLREGLTFRAVEMGGVRELHVAGGRGLRLRGGDEDRRGRGSQAEQRGAGHELAPVHAGGKDGVSTLPSQRFIVHARPSPLCPPLQAAGVRPWRP